MDFLIIALIAAVIVLCVINLLLISKMAKKSGTEALDVLKKELAESERLQRKELTETVQGSVGTLGTLVSQNQQTAAAAQDKKIEELDRHLRENQAAFSESVAAFNRQSEERFKTFASENEQKLDAVRSATEKQLTYIREENAKKLDEMRVLVDEKLQKTLNERVSESFKAVNDNLQKVYTGLGDMQTLAAGVGDLKKVLSNVKTRGTLGEIQLGAILKEILAPDQYTENYSPDSKAVVEFAVKIPNMNDSVTFLPIDSKFPGNVYESYRDAVENGAKEQVEATYAELLKSLKKCAKDIRQKYVQPPLTTDFAVMFLPFEGLYSTAVESGLVSELQKEFRVNIAGPSTLSAMLNSLQLCLRSYAINKRSAEVWEVLNSVKKEFETFSTALEKTQQHIQQAHADIDTLVSTRTNKMKKQLDRVESIEEISARE